MKFFLKIAFIKISGGNSLKKLALGLQTETIFSNFTMKIQKLAVIIELFQSKMKTKAFYKIKLKVLNEDFYKKNRFLLRNMKIEFSEKINSKQQEIFTLEQKIKEKKMAYQKTFANLQFFDKGLKEKEKSFEELKNNKNKMKKTNNLFEKIEGIENQVNIFILKSIYFLIFSSKILRILIMK